MSLAVAVPQFVVLARVEHGVCASGQILACNDVQLPPSAAGWFLSAIDADAFHFAFYSHAVAGDSREPYDRTGIAYVPLSLSQMNVTPLEGYGVMLLQASPRRRSIHILAADAPFVFFAHDRGALARIIARIAAQAGIRGDCTPALHAPARLLISACA